MRRQRLALCCCAVVSAPLFLPLLRLLLPLPPLLARCATSCAHPHRAAPPRRRAHWRPTGPAPSRYLLLLLLLLHYDNSSPPVVAASPPAGPGRPAQVLRSFAGAGGTNAGGVVPPGCRGAVTGGCRIEVRPPCCHLPAPFPAHHPVVCHRAASPKLATVLPLLAHGVTSNWPTCKVVPTPCHPTTIGGSHAATPGVREAAQVANCRRRGTAAVTILIVIGSRPGRRAGCCCGPGARVKFPFVRVSTAAAARARQAMRAANPQQVVSSAVIDPPVQLPLARHYLDTVARTPLLALFLCDAGYACGVGWLGATARGAEWHRAEQLPDPRARADTRAQFLPCTAHRRTAAHIPCHPQCAAVAQLCIPPHRAVLRVIAPFCCDLAACASLLQQLLATAPARHRRAVRSPTPPPHAARQAAGGSISGSIKGAPTPHARVQMSAGGTYVGRWRGWGELSQRDDRRD